MFTQVLLSSLIIMLTSLSGVLFTYKLARVFMERYISYLVSFSAGVFFIISIWVTNAAMKLFENDWYVLALLLLGYLVAWLVHCLIPENHFHNEKNLSKNTQGNPRKLLIGDAIHNVADGLVLVPAFATSPAIGIAVAISIVIHEMLQEISEFFVLRRAGYSVLRALGWNFLVSSTILLGVFLSYMAIGNDNLEGGLLAISAGFFLHVVVHDLFPWQHRHNANILLKHLSVVIVGGVLMFCTNILLVKFFG